MASSWHSVMQCSSLPHASARDSTAIPPSISRHLTPQTSTHRLQPVHLRASTTGNHFSFTSRTTLRWLLALLLHDDRALHPRVWRALKMHDTLLVELLGERAAGSEHGRSKLAFLTEHAVLHADLGILESHGLTRLDHDRLRTERLHRPFLPNARAGQHFDRDAVCRLHFRCGSRHGETHS